MHNIIWVIVMKNIDCNKYDDSIVPPCANLLRNVNPIIKDGKLIFRNLNRLYYFIGIHPKDDIISPELYANIQISLSTYLIGLIIDQIESKKIVYREEDEMHTIKEINDFIHKSINNPTNKKFKHRTILSLVYSNIDAILTPFQYILDISLNNFLILLTINRVENNPALFFINNSDATEDIFNFILSEVDISFKKV